MNKLIDARRQRGGADGQPNDTGEKTPAINRFRRLITFSFILSPLAVIWPGLAGHAQSHRAPKLRSGWVLRADD